MLFNRFCVTCFVAAREIMGDLTDACRCNRMRLSMTSLCESPLFAYVSAHGPLMPSNGSEVFLRLRRTSKDPLQLDQEPFKSLSYLYSPARPQHSHSFTTLTSQRTHKILKQDAQIQQEQDSFSGQSFPCIRLHDAQYNRSVQTQTVDHCR